MLASGPGRGMPGAIGGAAFGATSLLLLFAVGRPVATDDAWWHLALGSHFAAEGPWLSGDPLLFTAPRPAANASWLADVALARLLDIVGFHGLRFAHVATVAGLLALAVHLLLRESRSRLFACTAGIAFATLAAYRVFQLRPELATLLGTLLLYRFALSARAGPTPIAILGTAVGIALWANLHPAFVLALALIAVAALGATAAPLLAGRRPTASERVRIARIAMLLAAGAVATLANPAGIRQHLAYFIAGSQTPALEFVVDEWRSVAPFSLPHGLFPPSLVEWVLYWVLSLATLALGWRGLRDARRAEAPGLDPALVALAAFASLAPLAALRLQWLGIFPLLLAAQAWGVARPDLSARARARWLVALTSLCLLVAFVRIGPWERISLNVPTSGREYREPYATWDYFADAIWLMRDAGLEGHLYAAYKVGGFAGFWLAPKVTAFINGSLNVSPDAFAAYGPIRARVGARADESFEQLLDRFGIDLFLGIRLPEAGRSDEEEEYSAAHLERTAGWKTIFRNARSALYLRDDPRNAENLARVARRYASEGVPFDARSGFEPERVIRERPDWAIQHALVPRNYDDLRARSASAAHPNLRIAAMGQIATWYALLGLYDAAIELDTEILARSPHEIGPRRRLVWSLLRAGRVSDAQHEAESLDAADPLTREITSLARAAGRPTPELEARIRLLPLLTPGQSRAIASSLASPATRPR